MPRAEGELDAELTRAVRRTSFMRQCFYVVVLFVALAGQVSGAVEALGIPLIWAIFAVAGLELGGIVVLANADVRRRLGEHALASRLLSASIAAGAVAFNWIAHSNKLHGGFFAGMSALGYLVWLMHTENQRRDRLRAKGDLPPTTPAYEFFAHWFRHPLITMRAKSLAKANPELGLYDSLTAARSEVRRERRTSAISKVLHRKVRSVVDPTTADIAVAVYDLDEIANRLADGADYDGLTSLIAADLAPARLTAPPVKGRRGRRAPITAEASVGLALPVSPSAEAPAQAAQPILPPAIRRDLENRLARGRHPVNGQPAQRAATPVAEPVAEPAAEPAAEPVADEAPEPDKRVVGETTAIKFQEAQTVTFPKIVDEDGEVEPKLAEERKPAVGKEMAKFVEDAEVVEDGEPEAAAPATPRNSRSFREGSLRSRVHAALDAHVPDGDTRDNPTLSAFVGDLLQLNNVERLTAATYVRTWKKEVEAGRRASVNGRHLEKAMSA